jgi:Beta-propeller repeat/Abnormal spindle-like microcephaly-assoc'd, ASPM-SPD-2-Hydin
MYEARSAQRFLSWGLITAMMLVLSPCTIGDGYRKTSPFSASTNPPPVRVAVSSPPSAAAAAPAALLEGYGNLPLAFEANQGQSDARVKFISRGSGYALFLTPTEAVLSLRVGDTAGNKKSLATRPRGRAIRRPSDVNQRFELARHDRGREAILRMRLVGASSTASPAGLEELPGKLNYFIGSDRNKWRTDVPTFAKVRYESVYPGVDLIYHGDRRQLEYDFIVAPGANPDLIRMSFGGSFGEHGAVVPEMDAKGNLLLRTSARNIGLPLPFVYQQTGDARRPVSCRYALLGNNQVAFTVGAYDHSKPLIIDPVLTYSTYLGGGDTDNPTGIAADASGSAYIVGSTQSSDFPTTPGAVHSTFNNGSEAFITKLSPDGKSLIYSTYLGGSTEDYGNGIAVDAGGNAYVTGMTLSADFPTTLGAFQTVAKGTNGNGNAFIAKLAPDGKSLVYSTYLGGSGSPLYGGDSGNSIAVDAAGNAYATGSTSSNDFPTTLGTFQTARHAISRTAFVTKLAPDGKSLVYSTYLGGDVDDEAFAIAVDSALNAYVTGATSSSMFPTTPGVFQPTLLNDQNAFVSKLAADGKSLVYSTYLGGSGGFFDYDGETGTGIAVDSAFNAYVTGNTGLATFPTRNAYQKTFGGVADGFLSKFNAEGTILLYSTFLGGTSDDGGSGIALDSSGDVYVTGITDSGNFPILNALQSISGSGTDGGQDDVFVTKIDTTQSGTNSLIYSSFLGGTQADSGTSIAVDGSGNVYITGSAGAGFPVTPGAFQVSPGPSGCDDNTCDAVSHGFVVKIAPNSAPAFTLTEANLDFGNQGVGTNAPMTVLVGNAGASPLKVSNIVLTGINSAEFSESDACGASVPGGGACAVTVVFSPATLGSKTALITFSDDAAGSPHSMNVLGESVVAAPALSVSPTSYNFGNIAVGSTSLTPSIQLANTGNVPIAVSSVSLTGADSGDFVVDLGSLPDKLRPGDLGFVRPTFEPTTAGNRSATLTITDSAPGSPHLIALTGVGVAVPPDFTIFASPSSSTVTAGQPKSYSVTLTPIGGVAGTVSLSCSGAPSLATCTVPAPLAFNGTNALVTAVTVTTTAKSIVAPQRIVQGSWPRGGLLLWSVFALLFVTLMAQANKSASRPNRRLAYMSFAGALFVFLCVMGCNNSIGGGGGGSAGTPSGNYTLTITATSGSLSHSTIVTLVVD